MNDHASENEVRRFGKVTLMTRVTGLRSSYGYVRMGSVSVIHDRVGVARMGHPTAPYLSLSSHLGHAIDLGGPLVSPRWRSHWWAPLDLTWQSGGVFAYGCTSFLMPRLR